MLQLLIRTKQIFFKRFPSEEKDSTCVDYLFCNTKNVREQRENLSIILRRKQRLWNSALIQISSHVCQKKINSTFSQARTKNKLAGDGLAMACHIQLVQGGCYYKNVIPLPGGRRGLRTPHSALGQTAARPTRSSAQTGGSQHRRERTGSLLTPTYR